MYARPLIRSVGLQLTIPRMTSPSTDLSSPTSARELTSHHAQDATTGPFADCSVCMDSVPKADAIAITDDDNVCQECFQEAIKPLFVSALEFEFHYPVTWGASVLDPCKFRDALPEDFLPRWRRKVREYEAPVASRLYCRHRAGDDGRECGAFVTHKRPDLRSAFDRMYIWFCHLCRDCQGPTCIHCGFAIPKDATRHICPEELKENENGNGAAAADTDALAGLTKGRDYQDCPTCGVHVDLIDGCNHMTCPLAACRTSFCFICGTEADGDSEHWSYGKSCPRWNQPTADNAMYDRLDIADMEETERELAEFARGQWTAWEQAGHFDAPTDTGEELDWAGSELGRHLDLIRGELGPNIRNMVALGVHQAVQRRDGSSDTMEMYARWMEGFIAAICANDDVHRMVKELELPEWLPGATGTTESRGEYVWRTYWMTHRWLETVYGRFPRVVRDALGRGWRRYLRHQERLLDDDGWVEMREMILYMANEQ